MLLILIHGSRFLSTEDKNGGIEQALYCLLTLSPSSVTSLIHSPVLIKNIYHE